MKSIRLLFNWARNHAGWLIVLSFLVLHVLLINDYGLTWDYHFHFFGGGHFLGLSWQQLEPRDLPYVEPDPRKAWTLPYGPIMSIPPVASYIFFSQTLHLLPPDSAYHVPIIFWGVAGIAVLYVFMRQAFSRRIAWIAALLLALTPRYFGDLHNDMKDVPSAVSFALNMWLVWRLMKYKRPIDLVWAILAFAMAFNVKINSVFIPIVFAVWVSIPLIIRRSFTLPKYVVWYGFLAPVAAFSLWSLFWANPIGQLYHAYRTFGIGTNNIEVILNNTWYCSGSTVPWYYPYWYLLITTPLPNLLFFAIGLLTFLYGYMKSIVSNKNPTNDLSTKLLLVVWLFLPLSRYFIKSIGVIDGIRHFEEVLFPLAALSAIGLDKTLTSFRHVRTVNTALLILIFSFLSFTIYSYHPYQITYFNELVGGTKGAFGNYDLDYWGTSQKAAVQWVNTHAPPNAKVSIVMAGAVAGTYLRSDLIPNLNKYGYNESDFVIFLNRQSFFYRFYYAYEYLLSHTPTYTVSVDGAPLTWIFDNRSNNTRPPSTPWWHGSDPCILKYW